ncbi:MAG: thioesterase [Proteobacteria bacterium]|nr:MAG: thioesterase [Pseudomonadota bacterium]
MSKLIETYRGTVYPWHCDHMGHMNVMWYVGKFDEATWHFLSQVGLTPKWLRDNNRGMVAVDQRISYQRELLAGDVLVIRSGVLDVSAKKIRFFHEMRNAVSEEIAAITLFISLHLDTVSRKSTAMPEEVALRARERIVAYDLPW